MKSHLTDDRNKDLKIFSNTAEGAAEMYEFIRDKKLPKSDSDIERFIFMNLFKILTNEKLLDSEIDILNKENKIDKSKKRIAKSEKFQRFTDTIINARMVQELLGIENICTNFVGEESFFDSEFICRKIIEAVINEFEKSSLSIDELKEKIGNLSHHLMAAIVCDCFHPNRRMAFLLISIGIEPSKAAYLCLSAPPIKKENLKEAIRRRVES